MIFPFSRYTVYGNSMLPSIKPGHDVLVFNWMYIFSIPKVGDIVIIKHGNREIIKRIQKIYNSKYFVEGDNKNMSTDSRNFGIIPRSEIVGKVVYVR